MASRVDRLHERFGVEADGEHAALSAGALLQAASVVDDLDGLLEGEETGEIVGGHFACAVADHGVRGYPELLQLLGQRDLDGEVGGLCELRFGHAGTGFVGAQLVEQ